MAASEGLDPDTLFKQFRVEREIGRGAFGTVWLAHDTLLDRDVALKALHLPTVESPETALAEARLVGRTRSPHIVTLHGVHEAPGGGWVFEMEYLDGGSLEDLLSRDTPLPAGRARAIFEALLKGLGAAHECGIVHGDVKPGNVLLARNGDVKLADFGLARLLTETTIADASAGHMVGTPSYVAPEVIMGERPTAASDLWSAGVILYRMLTGAPPFRAENLAGLFYAIQNGNPEPPGPRVDHLLGQVALHCLAKSPADRPASCADTLLLLDRPPEPPPIPEPVARILGRTGEIERAGALLDRVAEGGGATLVLAGEPGIGKTALLHEITRRAAEQGFLSIEALVTPLEGLLRPLAQGVRRALPPGGIPDIPAPARMLLEEHPAFANAAQTVRAMEQLLETLSADQPVALAVEDAHDASEEEFRVLLDLAKRLPSKRALLVLTCEVGGAGGQREIGCIEGVDWIDLGPLAPERVYELLERGARVDAEVAGRIAGLAGGNPRFALEMLRHLEESGAVVRRGERLHAGPGFERAQLPRRFHDLVARRVAGLPEEDRALLDVAAVDGLEFDGEALAAVLDRPLLAVLRSLQRLARERGLVVPRAQGYRFNNPILREVLYRELAPAFRAALHARLAEHLEGRGRGSVDSERVGRHWDLAAQPERAAPYLRRAAYAAARRQELRRAIDLAARAGFVPGATDPAVALANPDVLFEVATTYSTLGKHEEAELLLSRLLDAAAGAKDEVLRLRTAVRYNRNRYFVKGAASVDAQELKRAAETLPKCGELGRAHYLLGMIAKYRGDLAEAADLLRRADEVFLELGDDLMHSGTLDQLASVALREGRMHEAERLYSEAARVAAAGGRRTNASISEANRILVAFSRGEVDETLPALEQVTRTLALEGAKFSAAHATVAVAEMRYARGDLAGAEAAVREAVGTLRDTSHLTGLGQGQVELAHILAVKGRLDEARASLHEAEVAARKSDDRNTLFIALALGAYVRAVLGDREGAAEGARAALSVETPQETRMGGLLFLVESCLYATPVGMLDGTEDLPLGTGDYALWQRKVIRSAIAGVRAAVDATAPAAPLRAAAEALAGKEIGNRRSALRIVAALLGAEADRRDGDTGRAQKSASRARDAAKKLGHVWLEGSALALLSHVTQSPAAARDLDQLRTRVAEGLRSHDDRAHIQAARFFPSGG